jgi:hypothetical protein
MIVKIKELLHLTDEHYQLLFNVRRSIRYHDRRRAFYERLHHLTSLLTILMAGSFLFDLAKDGDTARWLIVLSTAAAFLAALDMVIGYSTRASLHSSLRERFANLEIEMVTGTTDDQEWENHFKKRLLIEQDEPAIYKMLDLLCHNELLEAEGFSRSKSPEEFFNAHLWHKLTSQLFRWENVKTA